MIALTGCSMTESKSGLRQILSVTILYIVECIFCRRKRSPSAETQSGCASNPYRPVRSAHCAQPLGCWYKCRCADLCALNCMISAVTTGSIYIVMVVNGERHLLMHNGQRSWILSARSPPGENESGTSGGVAPADLFRQNAAYRQKPEKITAMWELFHIDI